jgi:hypothetical protein
METLQPYLSYLGIGAAIVGGSALLLWMGFAAMLSAATEGIPKLLGKFFNYLAMGDVETAYSLTSARVSTVNFSKTASETRAETSNRQAQATVVTSIARLLVMLMPSMSPSSSHPVEKFQFRSN